MNVELTLNIGPPEGTVAPIQEGYYMVGRHSECQIRPKSKSVSRRHCLLLNNEDGLGVLDLESTRGTYVNGTRLHPKTWRRLHDGDLVRCGKVTLQVNLLEEHAKKHSHSATRSNTPPSTATRSTATHSTATRSTASSSTSNANNTATAIASRTELTGSGTTRPDTATPQSWHSVDVDLFLSPDEIDNTNLVGADASPNSSQDSDAIDLTDLVDSDLLDSDGNESDAADELSVFIDTPLEKDGPGEGDTLHGTDDEAPTTPPPRDGGKTPEGSKSPARKKTKPIRPHKIPKPKRSKGPSRLPSFSLSSLSGDAETWKIVGAGVLALLLVGFAIYQLSSLISGPDVRVLRDLD